MNPPTHTFGVIRRGKGGRVAPKRSEGGRLKVYYIKGCAYLPGGTDLSGVAVGAPKKILPQKPQEGTKIGFILLCLMVFIVAKFSFFNHLYQPCGRRGRKEKNF
jgi:hypothetical protein